MILIIGELIAAPGEEKGAYSLIILPLQASCCSSSEVGVLPEGMDTVYVAVNYTIAT